MIGTAALNAAVAAAVTSTNVNITAALSATGLLTFSGTGAAAATLSDKINIALEAAYIGTVASNVAVFEHSGNTYVVNSNGTAGYVAGADSVVQLTGMTGVTALSTTASGTTTVWVT